MTEDNVGRYRKAIENMSDFEKILEKVVSILLGGKRAVRHGHNSRRFYCECGRFCIWGPNPKGKKYGIIECRCGIVHYKPLTNFRGQGKGVG
jgi:hypothetical protein